MSAMDCFRFIAILFRRDFTVHNNYFEFYLTDANLKHFLKYSIRKIITVVAVDSIQNDRSNSEYSSK